MRTAPDPLLVLLGLGDKVFARLVAFAAPWSSRSEHSSWENGYCKGAEDAYWRGYEYGLKDAATRRELLGRGR